MKNIASTYKYADAYEGEPTTIAEQIAEEEAIRAEEEAYWAEVRETWEMEYLSHTSGLS